MNIEDMEPRLNTSPQRMEWSTPTDQELGETDLWLPRNWGKLKVGEEAMRKLEAIFGVVK